MKKVLAIVVFCLPGLLIAQPFIGALQMFTLTENAEDPSENGSFEVIFAIRYPLIGVVPKDDGNKKEKGGTMVLNQETNKVTMLMENMGNKMKIELPYEAGAPVDNNMDGNEDIKVTLHDETRVIDSLICHRITTEDKEYKTEAWITTQLDINYLQLVNIMSQGKQDAKTGNETLDKLVENGFPMEITSVSKATGEKQFINFKVLPDFDLDAFFNSMDDYQIFNYQDMMPIGND